MKQILQPTAADPLHFVIANSCYICSFFLFLCLGFLVSLNDHKFDHRSDLSFGRTKVPVFILPLRGTSSNKLYTAVLKLLCMSASAGCANQIVH